MRIEKYIKMVCLFTIFILLGSSIVTADPEEAGSVGLTGVPNTGSGGSGDSNLDAGSSSGLDAWLHEGDLLFMDIDLVDLWSNFDPLSFEWWRDVLISIEYQKFRKACEHTALYEGSNKFIEALGLGIVESNWPSGFDWAKNFEFYFVVADTDAKQKAVAYASERVEYQRSDVTTESLYQTGRHPIREFFMKLVPDHLSDDAISGLKQPIFAGGYETEDKFYCSELPWVSYKMVNIPLDGNDGSDTTEIDEYSTQLVIPYFLKISEHTREYTNELQIDFYAELDTGDSLKVVCEVLLYKLGINPDTLVNNYLNRAFEITFYCDGEEFYTTTTTGKKCSAEISFDEEGSYEFQAIVVDKVDGRTVSSDKKIVTVGNSCFLADTKIEMADDSLKNIQDIEIGDMVKSYDEATQMLKDGIVTEVFHHAPEEMMDYYLVINDDLRVTPNHLLYINDRWIEADEITVDDIIGVGQGVVVTSVKRIPSQVPTYNLEVEPYHTYNVVFNDVNDELIVHNALGASKITVPAKKPSSGSTSETSQSIPQITELFATGTSVLNILLRSRLTTYPSLSGSGSNPASSPMLSTPSSSSGTDDSSLQSSSEMQASLPSIYSSIKNNTIFENIIRNIIESTFITTVNTQETNAAPEQDISVEESATSDVDESVATDSEGTTVQTNSNSQSDSTQTTTSSETVELTSSENTADNTIEISTTASDSSSTDVQDIIIEKVISSESTITSEPSSSESTTISIQPTTTTSTSNSSSSPLSISTPLIKNLTNLN